MKAPRRLDFFATLPTFIIIFQPIHKKPWQIIYQNFPVRINPHNTVYILYYVPRVDLNVNSWKWKILSISRSDAIDMACVLNHGVEFRWQKHVSNVVNWRLLFWIHAWWFVACRWSKYHHFAMVCRYVCYRPKYVCSNLDIINKAWFLKIKI